MTRYPVQEAKLEEILAKVRGGEKVILTDNGSNVAEIRPIRQRASTGDPQEDAYWQLVEEGVIVPAEAKPGEGELTPVVVKPGGLARFLADRD